NRYLSGHQLSKVSKGYLFTSGKGQRHIERECQREEEDGYGCWRSGTPKAKMSSLSIPTKCMHLWNGKK
ncbi:hypothetical protein V2J09_021922, partial [Rumex salicifolius]